MQRREFFQLMGAAGFSLLVVKIQGCAQVTQDGFLSTNKSAPDDAVILIYDIQMLGYSTLGSGYLGKDGILRATSIRDSLPLNLNYIQDSHGHKFSITPEDFAKLKRGEAVEIITTEAQGHKHKVVIDPKNRVPGSAPISVAVGPVSADIGLQISMNDGNKDRVYSMLSNEQNSNNPRLYVAPTTELDENSVQYCLNLAEVCAADASKWKKLNRFAQRPDKQIFVAAENLVLDPNLQAIPLQLRGTSKKTNQLLQFAMRIVRRGR